jgi:hypothetical protein
LKYEYKVEAFGGGADSEQIQKFLNSLGQRGWKLIAATENSDGNGDSCGTTIYLMRESVEDQPANGLK